MARARFLIRFGLLSLAFGILSFFTWLPTVAAALMNSVDDSATGEPSAAATQLHATLAVADLHADLLLWRRDPLRRASYGHTDLPRLQEGRVALQVLSAVTKVPFGMNYQSNSGDSDQLPLLMAAQRWPRRTWASPLARALFQADRLRDAARRSRGQLVVARSRAELDSALARRNGDPGVVAAVLAIEGLHALEGNPRNLDTLYATGYRIMGLAHFFDNPFAGSAHGVDQYGLTPLGRQLLPAMEARGITIDLAHASPAAFRDAVALATRPVVVSHGGVRATCPGPRNLDDGQIRAVASTGGVIGVGFWSGAVCATAPEAIVRAIRHVTDLVGVEYVGLGSDFDGSVRTPFDAAGLVHLTDALITGGFTADQIRAIMGENVIRVLLGNLPER